MGDGKAENSSHKTHGTGQPVPATPDWRELKEHWDLAKWELDFAPSAWTDTQETLQEVCGNCFK